MRSASLSLTRQSPGSLAELASSCSASSDSDSDSSSSSDESDSATAPAPATRQRGRGRGKQRAADSDADDDDESGVTSSKTAPKTEHELAEPDISPLTVQQFEEGTELAKFGKVESLIENVVVIKADTSGDWRVLDEGTLVCWEDRVVIGAVRSLAPLLISKLD